jgi:hypothetical protein
MPEPQTEIPPEMMEPFVVGPYEVNQDGTINCTFLHPELGAVPFTAGPDDVEAHGRAAYAYALTQLP